MSRHFSRLIASLLAMCLVMEPSVATEMHRAAFGGQQLSRYSAFLSEAFAARALNVGAHPRETISLYQLLSQRPFHVSAFAVEHLSGVLIPVLAGGLLGYELLSGQWEKALSGTFAFFLLGAVIGPRGKPVQTTYRVRESLLKTFQHTLIDAGEKSASRVIAVLIERWLSQRKAGIDIVLEPETPTPGEPVIQTTFRISERSLIQLQHQLIDDDVSMTALVEGLIKRYIAGASVIPTQAPVQTTYRIGKSVLKAFQHVLIDLGQKSATRVIADLIRQWLADRKAGTLVALEIDEKPTSEPVIQTTLRLPPEAISELQHQLVEDHLSMTVLIEGLIKKFVKEHGRTILSILLLAAVFQSAGPAFAAAAFVAPRKPDHTGHLAMLKRGLFWPRSLMNGVLPSGRPLRQRPSTAA
jgi:hypothetical protein